VTTTIIVHYGFAASVMPSDRGTFVYAEVYPASALVCWAGFGRGGWRRFWPLMCGRAWTGPHIRWWFEIQETEQPGEPCGIHWHEQDGGAITLRGALRKASKAVDTVVHLIREEEVMTT
jgi:hypothetical protein